MPFKCLGAENFHVQMPGGVTVGWSGQELNETLQSKDSGFLCMHDKHSKRNKLVTDI